MVEYSIEIEVVEGEKCRAHKLGDKLAYPRDSGEMCPWLLDSLNAMVRVLLFGGTLPWRYEGTPYQKETDRDGVTTEFVRCPDPTDAGIVVKITRRPSREGL
jgi:uncharacterized repeat protein (TIGR04076 family)